MRLPVRYTIHFYTFEESIYVCFMVSVIIFLEHESITRSTEKKGRKIQFSDLTIERVLKYIKKKYVFDEAKAIELNFD